MQDLLRATKLANKEVLTGDEAEMFLGVDKVTLYRYRQAGYIPYSCPTGKQCYYRKDDLIKFMTSNKVNNLNS